MSSKAGTPNCLKKRRGLKFAGSLLLLLSFEIEGCFVKESIVLLRLFYKLPGGANVRKAELIPLEN